MTVQDAGGENNMEEKLKRGVGGKKQYIHSSSGDFFVQLVR
jgi:hypothetical protein